MASMTGVASFLVPSLDLPIQEKRLAKELDLLGRARAEGIENRPATAAVEPDAIEREIVDRCTKAIDTLKQSTAEKLRACAERLTSIVFTTAERDFKMPAAVAGNEMAKLRLNARDDLVRLRLEQRHLLREREAFKSANGLSRSAHYPKAPVLAFSLLGLLMLGEAAANAYLFAKGNDLGLLGGWLQALTVGLANVAASFLAGVLIFRNLHHVSPYRRVLAGLACFAFLGLITGLHLAVAHYRTLLEVDPFNALAQTIPRLLADPLGIDNLEAVLLIVIGATATVIAVLDGYCLADDCYPGYGKIDRRYVAARHAYEDARAKLRQAIERVAETAAKAVHGRIKEVEAKAGKAVQTINESQLLLQRYEQSADEVVRTCHRLLATYRDENRRIRHTPPPAHFDHYPALDCALSSMPERLGGQRAQVLVERDEIVAAANHLLGRLREMVEQELTGLFAYVEEIEGTASRTLAEEAQLLRELGTGGSRVAWR